MKRALRHRLIGLLLLVASSGTTALHRAGYEAWRHGPPRLAEFGLSLATLMLASTGLLMLIHGAKLFERNREP